MRARSNGQRSRWIFLGFVLVAGFFLWTEHRAHAFQYLPYLLVLACPLMHLFHRHGGHGGHANTEEPEDQRASAKKAQSNQKPGRH